MADLPSSPSPPVPAAYSQSLAHTIPLTTLHLVHWLVLWRRSNSGSLWTDFLDGFGDVCPIEGNVEGKDAVVLDELI